MTQGTDAFSHGMMTDGDIPKNGERDGQPYADRMRGDDETVVENSDESNSAAFPKSISRLDDMFFSSYSRNVIRFSCSNW